jgi:hypothetical protein
MGNSNGTEYKTMGRTPSAAASPKLTCSPPPPTRKQVSQARAKAAAKKRENYDPDTSTKCSDENDGGDDGVPPGDIGLSSQGRSLMSRVQSCPRDRIAEGGRRLFTADYFNSRTNKLLFNTSADAKVLEEAAWRTLPDFGDKTKQKGNHTNNKQIIT